MDTTGPRKTICPNCGATNIGTHPSCLLCHAPLPVAAPAAPQWTSSQPGRPSESATSTPAVAMVCPYCGAPQTRMTGFCTRCGRTLST